MYLAIFANITVKHMIAILQTFWTMSIKEVVLMSIEVWAGARTILMPVS